jgi:lipid-A-disaccharide synthase-like uncharacterized protein
MALPSWIWDGNRFLLIEWHAWKVVGWLGNAVFFSRFLIQWIATEKRKQVVVPVAFWWLSLTGAMLLLAYSVRQRDSVFIFAYAFTWIPYIRNIVIHRRNRAARRNCSACGTNMVSKAAFCHRCGERFVG